MMLAAYIIDYLGTVFQHILAGVGHGVVGDGWFNAENVSLVEFRDCYFGFLRKVNGSLVHVHMLDILIRKRVVRGIFSLWNESSC